MITISFREVEAATRPAPPAQSSEERNELLRALQAYDKRRSLRHIDRLKSAVESWQESAPEKLAAANGGGIINRLVTQVINEREFALQLHIAGEVARKLLEARAQFFVNDADTSNENRAALQGSAVDTLKTVLEPDKSPKAILASLGLRNRIHWETKGAAVASRADMLIRCGESAALAVHTLRNDRRFSLPVSIIEQGNGSIDGHFWVVAGKITGNGEPDFGEDTFAIDLWGVGVGLIDHPVFCPAARPLLMRSNNKLRRLVTWRPGFKDPEEETDD